MFKNIKNPKKKLHLKRIFLCNIVIEKLENAKKIHNYIEMKNTRLLIV